MRGVVHAPCLAINVLANIRGVILDIGKCEG